MRQTASILVGATLCIDPYNGNTVNELAQNDRAEAKNIKILLAVACTSRLRDNDNK